VIVLRTDEVLHISAHDDPISDTTQDTERAGEIDLVGHDRRLASLIEPMRVAPSLERASNHLIDETMRTIGIDDSRRHSNGNPETGRPPRHFVTQVHQARSDAANRSFPAAGCRQVRLNGQRELITDVGRSEDVSFEMYMADARH